MTGEMVYTLENLTEFYRIAAMRMGARRYQIIRLLYLLGGAAVLLLGVYYGLDVLRGSGDIVVILLAAIGLYLGVQLLRTGCRFYAYFAARALKSVPENARRCYFSFEEDQIVISNRMKTISFPYEQFGMICETEQRFHFYINSYNGYILEKDGIRDGTADQLREWLNSKRAEPVERMGGC